MGDGALGSDHVNYLVLRYLQESGFENAAKSLYRDWHRDDDFRDPENLPFAPVVKQHELVHIIQDGLFHDQLQATFANGTRRFHLTATDLDLHVQAPRAKSISRRQSTYAVNDTDDFPLPPPKRVRSGNTDIVTNGDVMDVDDRPEDDDRTSMQSEQDREQSEPAAMEIVETKFAATQTDKAKRVHTRTIYWTLDKTVPVAILHLLWNSSATGDSFVLAAGDSLCRLYDLSKPDAIQYNVDNIDALDLGSEHCVTAAAWHPRGSHFTCAFKGPAQVKGQSYKHQLVDISTSGEKRAYDDWFNMFTIALRYTRSGNVLFAVATDGVKSVLQARDLKADNFRSWPTAYDQIDDTVVLDLACVSETSIAVCGKGLIAVWSLNPVAEDDEEDGAVLAPSHIHSADPGVPFDKIRYDRRHDVLVAASSSTGTVITLRKEDDVWIVGPSLPIPEDAGSAISGLVFQPVSDDEEVDTPSRLAVSFLGGASDQVCIFALTATTCDLTAILHIGPQEPPLALAWASHQTLPPTNGHVDSLDTSARIAAASDEAIKVWDVSVDHQPKECMSWKAAPANWYQADDHHLPDDEDAQTEPTLAWDSTGQRLAFAVGRKMAIVSILRDEDATINGLA